MAVTTSLESMSIFYDEPQSSEKASSVIYDPKQLPLTDAIHLEMFSCFCCLLRLQQSLTQYQGYWLSGFQLNVAIPQSHSEWN